jgi:seryl-tRNA synthetase
VLDLRLLRAEPERVRTELMRRGSTDDLDRVLELDRRAREVRTRVESVRAERGRITKEIGQAKRVGRDADELQDAARALGDALVAEEAALREREAARDELLLGLPNLAEPEAPAGGEDDAVTVRIVGTRPLFDFAPKDHLEIGLLLGGIDMEQAAKISGARFAYLMGPLVRLQIALVGFAVDLLEARGFTPVVPPVLVREEAMFGTGFFPTDRASIYALADDDLYLVGTSEVPLAGLGYEKILDADQLPLRYAGISTCFRREAGAAGRDTRGIFRVHQFDKIEMFSFSDADGSPAEHLRILGVQEEILTQLGLHYRVQDIAVGDLGASAARKFDCEAWMPGQDRFREVTSCSNCTDYQARRLNCRIRTDAGTRFVHTLNGTAVAVGRTLIALLETHQRSDGSVAVPAVLQRYGAPAELELA